MLKLAASAINNIQQQLRPLRLGKFPTPILKFDGLVPSSDTEVWLKHDGVCSSSYAGNKVRKLEFLLAEAKHNNAKHIITLGSAGSNHAVATSTYANQQGMDCTVCMVHQPTNAVARKNLLRHLYLGTELKLFKTLSQATRYAQEAAQAERTYLIPLGGSAPLASMGYVLAAAELAEQIEAKELPVPDRIYVACGTMGTAVGLALGVALLKLPSKIVAVRVTEKSVASPEKFNQLYAQSSATLSALNTDIALPSEINTDHVIFEQDFFGERYGQATRRAEAAIERAASLGISLDGTYTGKALSALIHDISCEQLKLDNVLFWNTLNAMDTPIAPAADYIKLDENFRSYFSEQ